MYKSTLEYGKETAHNNRATLKFVTEVAIRLCFLCYPADGLIVKLPVDGIGPWRRKVLPFNRAVQLWISSNYEELCDEKWNSWLMRSLGSMARWSFCGTNWLPQLRSSHWSQSLINKQQLAGGSRTLCPTLSGHLEVPLLPLHSNRSLTCLKPNGGR